MDTMMLVGGIALAITVASGGAVAWYFLMPRGSPELRNLMGTSGASTGMKPSDIKKQLQEDATGETLDRIKSETKKKFKTKEKYTLQERYFHAGMFSDKEKRDFERLRILAPAVLGPLGAIFCAGMGLEIALAALVIGGLVGFQIPFSILDRRVKNRAEDIMFYLPLVIEQIVIGVSSSLDIGPCLQRIVSMADERDSHNCVTELIRHAHFYVKSGVGLEDALSEVGRLSGHTELKHSFMALAQVAKHGGEITRQLQELADAVGGQREAHIEGKIKRLELEATGPVALVFMGFLVVILVGFGLQIKGALGG